MCFQRGSFFPSEIILSRTYTGYPQMCTSISFLCSHQVFVKMSCGDRPVRGSGMWFTRNTACLTARDQSVGSAMSGQWIAECSIMVRAIAMMVRMFRSADSIMVGAYASDSYVLLEVQKVAGKLG